VRFAACFDDLRLPGNAKIDDVVDMHFEKVAVPGTSGEVKGLAITVEGTTTSDASSQQGVLTLHEFYADGLWRFALAQAPFDECRNASG